MNKTSLILATALLAGHSFSVLAADNWPNRPIRLVAPFPAGSSVDAAVRVITPRMAESLGQPVVIDNRAGAGGTIGAEVGARAAPDGYTLAGGTTSTHALAKVLNPKLGYDPQRDFVPITLIGHLPYILAVHPGVAANNMQELIALARTKPGEIRYTTVGDTSMARLGGELLSNLTGIKITPIAYKSSAQSVVDTIAGRIELQFGTMAPVLPHVRSGKLRALAVTSAKRAPALPEVPTVQESGVKNFEVTLWLAVFAPTKTPRTMIERLNKEFITAIGTPQVRDALLIQGLQPETTTSAGFAKYLDTEISKWREVARKANLKPE
ncbi:MAG: tripartite tricarboxylate transporter substrate binding protein [Burkholderiales bacterium]|jgi:tripartite-type tricarboxylate transporter receptor subunit TctC|nr:tripartite tricarboxylate transporter substrate binding protein [Burkholderiales bacterium]